MRTSTRLRALACAWMLGAGAGAALGATPASDDEAASHVQFVEEGTATCLVRQSTQIQVRNTHARRTVRVWLERRLADRGTGDRSRSELKPGAAPEPLGCSKNEGAVQRWVIVRAVFAD